MTCYGHWSLDLDLGDGDTVSLCARYAGFGTHVLKDCEFCVWNRYQDDNLLDYGLGVNHYDIALAEGVEWK